ncbi:unnamed protein product [Absidia cylindrospora]
MPHIDPSEQNTGLQLLSPKRKAICDTSERQQKASKWNEKGDVDGSPIISDGKQSAPQDQSKKWIQPVATNNKVNVAMDPPLFMSTTLKPPLPTLPQVIRRSSRQHRPSRPFRASQSSQAPHSPKLQGHISLRPPRQATPDLSTPTQLPRWYKQSYMLFLALRQHPDHAMARTDLIKSALNLERDISTKMNFPKVFGGRTPQNSASAILTNNHGRHFQSYRPSGSKTMHFRLAFEPANFAKSVATYRQWMKILITADWPLCFGKPSLDFSFENGSTLVTPSSSSNSDTSLTLPTPSLSSLSKATTTTVIPSNHTAKSNIHLEDTSSSSLPLLTEFDVFIAIRQKERLRLKDLNNDKDDGNDYDDKKDQCQKLTSFPSSSHFFADPINSHDDNTRGIQCICDSIQWRIRGDVDYQATSKIPTCWQDIVRVQRRNGTKNDAVYAQRRLPINIPIGFYFGTPTVEDEFQLFKEDKGEATEYSLLHGRTVLDATDDDGQPFTDPTKEFETIYCPFHFIRQAVSSDNANILFLRGKIYNQVICWTKRAIQPNEELLSSP